ncbi:MAG: RES family NAD+ phosphorylase [Saprospiraceae bacterium]
MKVFRLTNQIHGRDLSGRGAELYGGRWNFKGIPMLYTSETRALCLAERLAHLESDEIPDDYVMVAIGLPDDAFISDLLTPGFPIPNWRENSQSFGSQFVQESTYLALRVPSVIVPQESNILLNPLHSDFHRVVILDIEPFEFDQRLFKA